MDEEYVLFGNGSVIKTRVALMGWLGVCYGVHGLEKMALSIFDMSGMARCTLQLRLRNFTYNRML